MLPQLTQHSALSPRAQLMYNAAGLAFIRIDNAHASALISLFGGQLLHYQRHGQRPLLWLSEAAVLDGSKAIRGGIPICWPWFGKGAEGQPQHGFARLQSWQLDGLEETETGTHLTLVLTPELCPGHQGEQWRLVLEIEIGAELTLHLHSENNGSDPMPFQAALHSYFRCAHVQQCRIEGLGHEYFDSLLQQACSKREETVFKEPVDRIYRTPAPLTRVHHSRHETRLRHQGNDSLVLWNPGPRAPADIPSLGWSDFVCIETAILGLPPLAAGDRHTLTLGCSEQERQTSYIKQIK